jgi:hypothetical protein
MIQGQAVLDEVRRRNGYVLLAGKGSRDSLLQQRQREVLQIKPRKPFGVLGIKPMPLDAAL